MTLEQRVERLEKAAGIENNKKYRVKYVHDIVLWLSTQNCTYFHEAIFGVGYNNKWAWNRKMWARCGQEVFPEANAPYEYRDSTRHRYLPEWVEEVEE